MAIRIFIDANIYLRFYDQKSSGFKNLIENMDKLKPSIFITSQIYNEVLRNKLEIAIKSIKEIGKRFSIKDAKFPEGFKEKEIIDWNTEIDNLARNENKLDLLGRSVIEMVANGTDIISKTLEAIFSNAVIPTETQILKARERKAFGNPPGKYQDPIGDQISWIQLLDILKPEDRLFIVSNDQDYLDSYSESDIYLNPFLAKELNNKQIKKENISCFNKFITALVEINKINPALLIPKEETIKAIEKEESIPLTYSGQAFITGDATSVASGIIGSVGTNRHCRNCGTTIGLFIGDQGKCPNCGTPW